MIPVRAHTTAVVVLFLTTIVGQPAIGQEEIANELDLRGAIASEPAAHDSDDEGEIDDEAGFMGDRSAGSPTEQEPTFIEQGQEPERPAEVLAPTAGEQASAERIKPGKTESPVERLLKDRFDVGVWYREIELQKERIPNYDPTLRNGFLPKTTIDHLEVEQDRSLIPFLRINLCPYLSVWLSRGEEVRAVAWTHGDESWDGVIALEASKAIYGEVRIPLKWGIAPYAFYGEIDYEATFEHNPSWYAGGRRKMFLDDTRGDRYGFGVQWKFARYAGFEVFWSRTDLDVYGRYYLLGELRSEGNFPLSHKAVGFSVFVYY